MNNISVESVINDCKSELLKIENIISVVGTTSLMSKYLTHYCLIKVSGVLEYSYKSIIADFHNGASVQVQNYISKTVRESSKNPSIDNIHSLLKCFDTSWNTAFSRGVSNLPGSSRKLQSLKSLNEERNAFAHGQPCAASFQNIKDYFNDAVEIIYVLDSVVV